MSRGQQDGNVFLAGIGGMVERGRGLRWDGVVAVVVVVVMLMRRLLGGEIGG